MEGPRARGRRSPCSLTDDRPPILLRTVGGAQGRFRRVRCAGKWFGRAEGVFKGLDRQVTVIEG